MSAAPSGLGSFADSIARYEAWMRKRLGRELDEDGLARKRETLRNSAFEFLRGTCWRWAEGMPVQCPELWQAPRVPSVGDAHAGNFGLWRDAEVRLVWGVNDYDEAAMLPWPVDLVRLCASFKLAEPALDHERIAEQALRGYRKGLDRPRPAVLEDRQLWLRKIYAAKDAKRLEFWQERRDAELARAVPPHFEAALRAAAPEPGLVPRISARQAGVGSLGRPRYVALFEVRGAPFAIEAKARLPSCWDRDGDLGFAARVATSGTRSPDPMLRYGETLVLRRLGPDSRKLDVDEIDPGRIDDLIAAMARELAAVHCTADASPTAIAADLAARRGAWLADAARRMTRWTNEEYLDNGSKP